MRVAILALTLLAPTVATAQSRSDPAMRPVTPRDIPYYMAHPSIMEQTLQLCHSNAGYGRLADCQNAERASTGLMANERGRAATQQLSIGVYSPEWWDLNPIMRETVITQCNRRGPGDQIAYPYCKLAAASKLRAIQN